MKIPPFASIHALFDCLLLPSLVACVHVVLNVSALPIARDRWPTVASDT
jgi:hypothetical protein